MGAILYNNENVTPETTRPIQNAAPVPTPTVTQQEWDIPKLSNINDLSGFFSGCTHLCNLPYNGYLDIFDSGNTINIIDDTKENRILIVRNSINRLKLNQYGI